MEWCGELLYRVLERAVFDVCLFSTAELAKYNDKIRRSAMNWIWSDSEDLMSFRFVCFHLDLDPDWVRRQTRAAMESGVSDVVETIGDAIRTSREKMRMTQVEFGKLFNYSYAQVSVWEHDKGKNIPPALIDMLKENGYGKFVSACE